MNQYGLPILLAALALAACSSTQTNDPSLRPDQRTATLNDGALRGAGGATRSDEMLFRGITLSAEQQTRVDSIRASYRIQIEQARRSSESAPDTARQRGSYRPSRMDQGTPQILSMMQRQRAAIRAVLTVDQQKVFDQNVAEIRTRMQ